ncbi:MAG: helix-turn-helix domain-containing protein [Candidatus Magasanikbacteria bacterium]|nr:helix-turn-helix domain-containing protein [Candidatus Magasanikbacteria bacterium]
MDNNFETSLKEFGLTNEEARVYDALLELGQSVVSPIATSARVNRTTCYNILEKLVAKKLASKSNFRGKKAYSVSDPSQIVENLEAEKKNLEKKLIHAKQFQTEITQKFTRKYTKPIIKYVEGLDGLKELYEDSLKCVDKQAGLRAYTSMRDLTAELGSYAQNYFEKRAKRGIPIRGIAPDTEFAKHAKKVQNKFLRTTKLIPKEKFDFSPEIYLYDNKLAVFSFKERFGFLLESKEIVDALKIAWQLAWERAEEYDKNIKF